MSPKLFFALFVSLLPLACMSVEGRMPNNKERGLLGTEMVNLSSSVDMYLSLRTEPPNEPDAVLLQEATAHDPGLLAPDFKRYLLKVRFQRPFSVLLLCSKDGRRAIMEDAGCSARLDRQIYKDAPCEFNLQVFEGCRVEGADP